MKVNKMLHKGRDYWISATFLASWVLQASAAAPAPLIITAPLDGASVTAGQPLEIVVAVKSGAYPHGIAIIGHDPLGASDLQAVDGSTVHFTMRVPARTPPGSYAITAVAPDSSGMVVTSTPVSVLVERADVPTALTMDPRGIVFAYVGQTLPLTIFAMFPAGLQTDVTQSSHLIVNSADPNVAIVEQGMVWAMGSGRTHIDARYGSISGAISITVPAYVRGDLNGDGIIDESDLNVILAALNHRANGQNDARDLNHDGVINEVDAQILKSLCTHPRCASQ